MAAVVEAMAVEDTGGSGVGNGQVGQCRGRGQGGGGHGLPLLAGNGPV